MRAEAGGRADYAIPNAVRSDNEQSNRLALLLRKHDDFREQHVLNGSVELIGGQVVLPRCRAPEHANVENDDILLFHICLAKDGGKRPE